MTLFACDARLKAAERAGDFGRSERLWKRRASLYDLPHCDCVVDAKGDQEPGPLQGYGLIQTLTVVVCLGSSSYKILLHAICIGSF
jgi:hypothetical protein